MLCTSLYEKDCPNSSCNIFCLAFLDFCSKSTTFGEPKYSDQHVQLAKVLVLLITIFDYLYHQHGESPDMQARHYFCKASHSKRDMKRKVKLPDVINIYMSYSTKGSLLSKEIASHIIIRGVKFQ
ncbi:hypothetical protein CEXT_777371 [Caerostris extrusa]|uniref:Uncharacterized protein n=1 Tax=Caerostris extrusa TaxID=172846 RepID=A0AAV4NC63_CAEEX|nr:hypothetical protein CEXT_777371 [Caerostris extrusa]